MVLGLKDTRIVGLSWYQAMRVVQAAPQPFHEQPAVSCCGCGVLTMRVHSRSCSSPSLCLSVRLSGRLPVQRVHREWLAVHHSGCDEVHAGESAHESSPSH